MIKCCLIRRVREIRDVAEHTQQAGPSPGCDSNSFLASAFHSIKHPSMPWKFRGAAAPLCEQIRHMHATNSWCPHTGEITTHSAVPKKRDWSVRMDEVVVTSEAALAGLSESAARRFSIRKRSSFRMTWSAHRCRSANVFTSMSPPAYACNMDIARMHGLDKVYGRNK